MYDASKTLCYVEQLSLSLSLQDVDPLRMKIM